MSLMSKEDAVILEKLYKYRNLIRSGKIRLPLDSAKKFVGPDVAYHLYSVSKLKKKSSSSK